MRNHGARTVRTASVVDGADVPGSSRRIAQENTTLLMRSGERLSAQLIIWRQPRGRAATSRGRGSRSASTFPAAPGGSDGDLRQARTVLAVSTPGRSAQCSAEDVQTRRAQLRRVARCAAAGVSAGAHRQGRRRRALPHPRSASSHAREGQLFLGINDGHSPTTRQFPRHLERHRPGDALARDRRHRAGPPSGDGRGFSLK